MNNAWMLARSVAARDWQLGGLSYVMLLGLRWRDLLCV